jgi:SAM-dependent methyltransferase
VKGSPAVEPGQHVLGHCHERLELSARPVVEPEPHLRGLAVRAARAAALPVSVRAGRAESLPLPEASVDAAVLCLVMCSLPDRVAALAELRRVLRPGGVVRFLEHTRADPAGLALVQRIADATLWPWFTGGCKPPATPSPPCATPASPSPGCAGSGSPPGRAAVQPSSPHVLGAAQAERRR